MKTSIKKIEQNLIFIYGLLGTMPIISVFGLTIFSWLTVAVVFFFIIFRIKENGRISKFITPYMIVVCLSAISAFLCLNSSMPSIWKNQQVKGLVWNILYLIVFICFSKSRNDIARTFIRGVYISSIVHMVWGFLQFILYTAGGIKLNDVIFVDLLHMSADTVTQIKDGSIALSGLCWNAGNMAPLLILGFAMSTTIPLKAAFALCTFLSGSRAAVLGLVTYIIISYVLKPGKSKVSKRVWLVVFGIIVVGVPILLATGKMESITSAIQKTISYFSRDTLTRQASAIIHLRYLTSVFDVARFAGITKILFGFGIGCSGYPFTVLYQQYNTVDFGTWVVECDIINQLWSTGLIALIVRYVWYIKYAKSAFKIDKKLFCFFIAFFVEGLVYNVTFNWSFIMLVCMFILVHNKQPISVVQHTGNKKVVSQVFRQGYSRYDSKLNENRYTI